RRPINIVDRDDEQNQAENAPPNAGFSRNIRRGCGDRFCHRVRITCSRRIVNMSERKLLGMLVPSSNTVLEPTCAAMLTGVANVSAHFARFRVTEIALTS